MSQLVLARNDAEKMRRKRRIGADHYADDQPKLSDKRQDGWTLTLPSSAIVAGCSFESEAGELKNEKKVGRDRRWPAASRVL